MNLFTVPSWYPSESNPMHGIFIKEQIEMLAKLRPAWKIGVSTWGQGDARKLLYAKDHFFNVSKILNHLFDEERETHPLENLSEFYSPAVSWTKKWRKGNLMSIIKASDINFQKHSRIHGKPNIFWIQAAYPGAFIGKYLSAKYEIPYILHTRLGGFMFEKLLSDTEGMKDEFLESINQANAVTATSEFQRQSLVEFIPKAKVLYNPVNIDHFSQAPTSGKDILIISRLEIEKGVDILIEAMKDVPMINLDIVGTGSQLKKLERQVISLGLDKRVMFSGELNREAIKDKIQACSFLVLSSRFETFGNVLVEAMACGRPVVATRCGGPEEIVTKTTGYLCEPNSNDLAEKINLMIQNRYLFDEKEIRESALTKYASNVWVKEIELLFKSVSSASV